MRVVVAWTTALAAHRTARIRDLDDNRRAVEPLRLLASGSDVLKPMRTCGRLEASMRIYSCVPAASKSIRVPLREYME